MILTPAVIRETILVLWGRGRLNEAAKSIGCSTKTVTRWINEETDPPARFCGAIRRAATRRIADVIAQGEKIGCT
jgi:Sec-independent protein translocase protein TatA